MSGMPGIDPHRLHEVDPTELTKALDPCDATLGDAGSGKSVPSSASGG